MLKTDKALLLFAKFPELGKVKTRLARTLGDEKATAIYTLLLRQVIHAAEATGFDVFLYCTPSGSEPFFASITQKAFAKPQRAGDLGERMAGALEEVFHMGYAYSVLAGSDIPGLTANVFTDAFAALHNVHMVLGEAADGGYYLVGFQKNAFRHDLFHGIRWSSATVFSKTCEKAKEANLQVAVLPVLSDIDTETDIHHYITTHPNAEISVLIREVLAGER